MALNKLFLQNGATQARMNGSQQKKIHGWDPERRTNYIEPANGKNQSLSTKTERQQMKSKRKTKIYTTGLLLDKQCRSIEKKQLS